MARVLVVDDEEPILSIVAEVVEDMGHQVLRAVNGREALQVIRATPPEIVLSDVMMPFLNGLDLCRTIKADPATKHIVVVLMSAVPADRGQAVDADGFVHKPFSLEDVEAAIEDGLARVGSTR
ncbi:MAG TPA: response regulator [Dehalococcoidia bacterium]|jgi:two-component system sensor histidine kinase/response regulator|nr:response regulator [Dehalococcoidia bacterium]